MTSATGKRRRRNRDARSRSGAIAAIAARPYRGTRRAVESRVILVQQCTLTGSRRRHRCGGRRCRRSSNNVLFFGRKGNSLTKHTQNITPPS